MSDKVKRPFRARYESTCLMCLRSIDIGDRILRSIHNDGYYHADKEDCAFYKECTRRWYD